jgi:hypothetical protein
MQKFKLTMVVYYNSPFIPSILRSICSAYFANNKADQGNGTITKHLANSLTQIKTKWK